MHCYYEDLIEPIFKNYLAKHSDTVDLFLTVSNHISLNGLQEIVRFFPNVYILMHRNCGRDIYPFLKALKIIVNLGYEFSCKLHTKKSPEKQDDGKLRQLLLDGLLGGANQVQQVVEVLIDNPTLGVLTPKKQIVSLRHRDLHVDNIFWLDKLLTRMGRPDLIGTYAIDFPAGSMYWFRVQALVDLEQLVLPEDLIEEESGQLDGTLAHSIERIIALYAAQRGYRMMSVESVYACDGCQRIAL